MAKVTRRAALAALGAVGAVGALGGLAYALREIFESDARPDGGMMGSGMMGNTSPADMNVYMEMFNRHNEIKRVVEQIPGGVRTTTQSDAPDLTAQLHTHVSTMYSHLQQGDEMTCMSRTLPTLFQNANNYRRQLTLTPTGVIAEETSDDPHLTDVIREHAKEIDGFVREGMSAMMRGMMGNGTMPGMP
jgi:hypothetical protein